MSVMEYRYLGRSGLKVSALSLGAWITQGLQIGDDVAEETMDAAYQAGVNFFDNAEGYGAGNAETTMGNVIKKKGWKRSDLVISTKIFWGGSGPNDRGLSRKHIIEGLDASLKRLQLDYVDILYCHRPDQYTPIEETVRAMNHVINQGKVFYWGTSEWSSAQIMEAHAVADRLDLIPPQVEQPQYSMLHRTRFEQEYAKLFAEKGMGSTIWSPLASGLLTGKYNDGIPEGSRLSFEKMDWLKKSLLENKGMNGLEEKDFSTIISKVKKLSEIATELNCTTSQLAIAWCLKNPNVSSVITGASKRSQVEENMKSLQVVPKLNEYVMEKIETILANKPSEEKDWRKF